MIGYAWLDGRMHGSTGYGVHGWAIVNSVLPVQCSKGFLHRFVFMPAHPSTPVSGEWKRCGVGMTRMDGRSDGSMGRRNAWDVSLDRMHGRANA